MKLSHEELRSAIKFFDTQGYEVQSKDMGVGSHTKYTLGGLVLNTYYDLSYKEPDAELFGNKLIISEESLKFLESYIKTY